MRTSNMGKRLWMKKKWRVCFYPPLQHMVSWMNLGNRRLSKQWCRLWGEHLNQSANLLKNLFELSIHRCLAMCRLDLITFLIIEFTSVHIQPILFRLFYVRIWHKSCCLEISISKWKANIFYCRIEFGYFCCHDYQNQNHVKLHLALILISNVHSGHLSCPVWFHFGLQA